jgi:hypothetical protein
MRFRRSDPRAHPPVGPVLRLAARFELASDEERGTDLTLVHDVEDRWHAEVNAGWVSVLMALKAAADHGVDLRNHDADRTWWQGYCDN